MEALTDTELFRALAGLGWIDRVALGVVVIATLRGLWIGLLREAFSVANDLMTPTMKIKRHRIRALCGERLDALYG